MKQFAVKSETFLTKCLFVLCSVQRVWSGV